MLFYPHRTVEDQMDRLPPEIQQKYKETQLDRIEIDGELITGYFDYSFLEEKSYKEQPVRMDDGSIPDLNNYQTFLTPRIIIRYNMMNIDDYRKLMKKLKSKRNAFMVTCYDIVEDKRVTHEMYFAPPQMPVIYQQYLMALGIQEYTIELIGTNRTDNVTITYEFNLPDNPKVYDPYPISQTSTSEQYNPKILNVIRGESIFIEQHMEPLSWLMDSNGYTLVGWNSEPDNSGFFYEDGGEYYFSNNLTLYAQWRKIN